MWASCELLLLAGTHFGSLPSCHKTYWVVARAMLLKPSDGAEQMPAKVQSCLGRTGQ